MAKPQDRFKSRKVYKTTEKPNGDGTDDVWKTDKRWDRSKETGPGTGWVKNDNIPRANSQPYKGRPTLDSYEAAYKKATMESTEKKAIKKRKK